MHVLLVLIRGLCGKLAIGEAEVSVYVNIRGLAHGSCKYVQSSVANDVLCYVIRTACSKRPRNTVSWKMN